MCNYPIPHILLLFVTVVAAVRAHLLMFIDESTNLELAFYPVCNCATLLRLVRLFNCHEITTQYPLILTRS
jgi:hypothetical protein